MKEFRNFDEFYQYYLESHSNVWNRRMHLFGWVAGISMGIWSVQTYNLWMLPIAVAFGLGIALLGHYFMERNDSVVFKFPMWTTLADIRMFSDMARGRLP